MGTIQNTTATKTLEHFSKRFIISAHPLDPEGNLMFYMHEKLSHNKYILRIVTTNDSQDKVKLEELVCKKLAMGKDFGERLSVLPIDHYIFQQDKGYCNSLSKCYLLFNTKNSQTLTHQLARSSYTKNTSPPFSQQVIYKGLRNLVQGLNLLKFYNHPHRHINCDTVYYNQQNQNLYLSDPWISPLTDFHQQYHSPEKLKQIRNQIDRFDTFISDLFSIGVVGLRMLGFTSVAQCYSGKKMDVVGLRRLAEGIRDSKLKGLILKLLSQDVEIRSLVFHQVKNIVGSKADLSDSNVTRTRNLNGKVSSVRKSFFNQSRPISKTNLVPQPLEKQLKGARYTDKLVTSHLFGPVNQQSFPQNINPFSKNKTLPQQNSQFSSPFMEIKSNLRPIQLPRANSTMNDKPEIDMNMPITPSNLISASNSRQLNEQSFQFPNSNPNCFQYPNHFQSYTTSQFSPSPAYISFMKNTSLTPTTAHFTNNSNVQPYFPSPNHNITLIPVQRQSSNNYFGSYHGSNASLQESVSDKFLKSVSSTPVGLQNSQPGGKAIPVSMSQGGLLFKQETKIEKNIKTDVNQRNKSEISKLLSSDLNFSQINPISQPSAKQPNIINSSLVQPPPLPYFSLSIPISTSSPPTQKQVVKQQKQEQNRLRTHTSYPSSQSFETDHVHQNKILQNLKALQNKVSEAIINSHLSQSSRQFRGTTDGMMQGDNSGKMVESVIVAKQQDASNHSTVKAINQQLKIEDIGGVSKHCRQNTGQQMQKEQSSKIKVNQEDRISPILVRQSQQSSLHSHRNSSSSSSPNNESIDFLNINQSKQSADQKQSIPQSQAQVSPQAEQQRFQDVVTTPAKNPSVLRLEGNNLTIPEQSDEQSVSEGAESRYRGEYVEQVYENGGKYVGYMLNGMRNGNGVFYYKDGGYYDGRWKQNMMNGYGKLYYQTGKLAYQGQWYQDQFHGRGTVYNDQPQQLRSSFDYNNMNSSETYWQYYEGDLSHDMKARYGKLMLSNGEYYEGQFKNDLVHGKGQFHQLDGKIVKGLWSQGMFVREI